MQPIGAFGDSRIAFIVDVEPTVIHRLRPGALDNPVPREHLEGAQGDLAHDFGGDVELSAVRHEGLLEPAVAEELRQAGRLLSLPVDRRDATGIVARRRDVLAGNLSAFYQPTFGRQRLRDDASPIHWRIELYVRNCQVQLL